LLIFGFVAFSALFSILRCVCSHKLVPVALCSPPTSPIIRHDFYARGYMRVNQCFELARRSEVDHCQSVWCHHRFGQSRPGVHIWAIATAGRPQPNSSPHTPTLFAFEGGCPNSSLVDLRNADEHTGQRLGWWET
jgi:hypothetical protein